MQLILHSIFKIRIDGVGLETVAYESYGENLGTGKTWGQTVGVHP